MPESKFEGTIIVKSTKRGTKIRLEPWTSMKWAGKEFKVSQEKRLGKIKGLKLGSSRGTSKMDLTKMQKTSIPKVDGRYISSKKGTELLKI